MIDTCNCSFVQTIERKMPRVNCNVNYELQVIVMSPCRFIKCNKYTILMGDVDSQGGYACMGFASGSDSKASACNAGDLGSILGSGRSPGEGNSNPLEVPGRLQSMGSKRVGHD